MATKKTRIKEAEFVDQNETQAQAVPATDTEVAQAAPVEAVPAEPILEDPVEDEAVLPEGTGNEVEVNPETISVEVQIPTSELAAAVAQATGDVEAASISPDIEQAQEAELVASDNSEDIPVEGATEEASAGEAPVEEAQPVVESLESNGDKLSEESNTHYEHGLEVETAKEERLQGEIDHNQSVIDHTLKESEEVEDAEGLEEEPVGADENEGLPPGMAGIEGDYNFDFDGEEVDVPDDFELNGDDPAVQDFLSKIDDYLSDEAAQPAQVADALRASADLFDAVAPRVEDEDELLDVEEDGEEEDTGDIPLDLDAIDTDEDSIKTGDDVLDQFSDLPEEEDYEESIERVPCKFPKKRFGEGKRAPRDLPLVRENKKLKEKSGFAIRNTDSDGSIFGKPEFWWDEVGKTEIFPSRKAAEEAIADRYAYDGEEDTGKYEIVEWEDEDWDAYEEFDALISEWGEGKTLRELLRFISNYDPDIITNFVDEVKSGRWESELYAESKKPVAEKLKEEADYSGVKFPAGSEDADDNLVEAYEKTQASRRKAIKNFRESVIRNENRPAFGTEGRSRFDEALRSSVKTNRINENSNPNSWANNRFIERYDDSLDFRSLLDEGLLG